MAAIHKEFGVLLSPGSLYPLLHLLEERKLVESYVEGGKKVYVATNVGRARLQSTFAIFTLSMNQLENFVSARGSAEFITRNHAE